MPLNRVIFKQINNFIPPRANFFLCNLNTESSFSDSFPSTVSISIENSAAFKTATLFPEFKPQLSWVYEHSKGSGMLNNNKICYAISILQYSRLEARLQININTVNV